VFGSNLAWDTTYRGSGFSWFSSDPSEKFRFRQDRFLPNHFQFMIHEYSYHPTHAL
jgi:hypothetical protein